MVSIDSLYDAPIPEELERAVREFRAWDVQQLALEQEKSTVTDPLYQYTGVERVVRDHRKPVGLVHRLPPSERSERTIARRGGRS